MVNTVISVVVVAYNIPRELPRTIKSITTPYQREIVAAEVEIVVVDNGSTPPVDAGALAEFGSQVRLVRIEDAQPSPAAAINRGLSEARGDVIGVMIDGARLATPSLLHFAMHAVALYPRTIAATLGWYLGADFQRLGMSAGYTRHTEDELLDDIAWVENGYRLFEVSTLDESSVNGWFAPISESNALFATRDTWDQLEGFDERFDFPGGGLLNLDTFSRAMALEGARLVILLGEGTFHQLHGGVSTNAPDAIARWDTWAAQYEKIRGIPYSVPERAGDPLWIGTLPAGATKHLVTAAVMPLPHHLAPLGRTFDRLRWGTAEMTASGDPVLDALLRLAGDEIAADRLPVAAVIARRARHYAPSAVAPQQLLTFLGAHSQFGDVPLDLMPHRDAALAVVAALIDATG